MRYLADLNRNKIFKNKYFIISFVLLFATTLIIIRDTQSYYLREVGRNEISDGTEYKYLLEESELTEDEVKRLSKKYFEFKFPEELNRVDIKDSFKLENIILVYGYDISSWINYDDTFYQQRNRLVGENILKNSFSIEELNENTIDRIKNGTNPTSIKMGYLEGWKIIDKNFSFQMYVLWLALALIILPIFNEDENNKTKELFITTKYGKDKLCFVRRRNIIEISVFLFIFAVMILVIPIYFIYGLEGAGLPIQSCQKYFLSPYTITNLQLFAYRCILGLLTTISISFIYSLISMKIKDIKNAYGFVFLLGIIQWSSFLINSEKYKYFVTYFTPREMISTLNFSIIEYYFGVNILVFRILLLLIIILILGKNIFRNS